MLPVKRAIGVLSLIFLASCQHLEVAEKQLPLVMDVDTGRDDAWALFGAMKDCRVEGVVASYGNVPLAHTVRNSLDVVAKAERDLGKCGNVFVWQGEEHPLANAPESSLAEIARRARTNGNGICNLTLPQSEQIVANRSEDWTRDVVSFLRARGQSDYIVAGPLTDLARLIDAFGKDAKGGPDILNHIRHVVVMGGSIDPNLAVDFNFQADPAAAQKVMATFGERLILVPYDETRKLRLTEEEIGKLRPQDGAAAFSKDLMLAQARGWSKDHAILLHDPATLLALEKNAPIRRETFTVVQTGDKAGKLVDDTHGVAVQRLAIPAGAENATRDRLLHRYLDLK